MHLCSLPCLSPLEEFPINLCFITLLKILLVRYGMGYWQPSQEISITGQESSLSKEKIMASIVAFIVTTTLKVHSGQQWNYIAFVPTHFSRPLAYIFIWLVFWQLTYYLIFFAPYSLLSIQYCPCCELCGNSTYSFSVHSQPSLACREICK